MTDEEEKNKKRDIAIDILSKEFAKVRREERDKMIKEILAHKFNTYKSEIALMDGNTKLSTLRYEIVIPRRELSEYLKSL